MQQRRTRFAPSPTGLLHVGHAYAVMQVEKWAKAHDAEVYLRIEDIDNTRCRAEWVQAIPRDLHAFGFTWQGEVRQQSQHRQDYRQALQCLRDLGVVYPCFCTRKHIHDALQALATATTEKFDAYPQTCRYLTSNEQQKRMKHERFSWRLNVDKAKAYLSKPLTWQEGEQVHLVDMDTIGDVILARKDIGTSYHMAVVLDDAMQAVTDVVRGEDLRSSTAIHVLLQALLALPSPHYHHHRLLCHSNGQRLAKSQRSIGLYYLQQAGLSPQNLRDYLCTSAGVWGFLPEDSPEYIVQQLGS